MDFYLTTSASTFPRIKITWLIKHMECFYLIDPHARNCLGMPDPNGMFVLKLDLNLKHHMCVHDVLGIRMK
jgi:hypothetical protein